MKILSTTVGLLAWLVSGWHLAWSVFHDGRVNTHNRRASVHTKRRDERLEEAARIEAAASALAPPKAKVIAAPVEPEPAQISPPPPTVEVERRALAVAVRAFPSRAADDCA